MLRHDLSLLRLLAIRHRSRKLLLLGDQHLNTPGATC